MTPRTLIVAVLALVCGVSAAVAVMRSRAPVETAEIATTLIVTAKVPIPRNSRISAEMLEMRPYPAEFILPNSALTLEEVVDLRATFGFLAGEPILKDKVGSGNPSGDIPVGMRTVSIQARGAHESGAGWIHPGDFVDVFLTLTDKDVNEGTTLTVVLFQHIEVFAMGAIRGESQEDHMGDAATVTLLLKPHQVQAITLTEGRGSYTLALRSPDDDEELQYEQVELADLPVMQELDQLLKKQAAVKDAEKLAWQAEWERNWALTQPEPPLEETPVEAIIEPAKAPAPPKVYEPPRYVWVFRGTALQLQLAKPGRYRQPNSPPLVSP